MPALGNPFLFLFLVTWGGRDWRARGSKKQLFLVNTYERNCPKNIWWHWTRERDTDRRRGMSVKVFQGLYHTQYMQRFAIIYVIYVFVPLLMPKHILPTLGLDMSTPSLFPSLSLHKREPSQNVRSNHKNNERWQNLLLSDHEDWNVTKLWTVTRSWTTAKVTNDQKSLTEPPQNYEPPRIMNHHEKIWAITEIMNQNKNSFFGGS